MQLSKLEKKHFVETVLIQYRKGCHLEEAVTVLDGARRTFQQLKLSRHGKGYFDRW